MMRSSKSFFNKAVLSKDMTRFLPVWLTFAIMTVLNLSDISMLFFEDAMESMVYAFQSGVSTNFFFALITAGCLFGDLFNRQLCNAVHTLPVRRESWFATHMLAGFLFWIGPMALKALVYCLTLGEFWYIGLLWLGAMLVQYLFFLSLAALCAMCTGTRVGMAAMYLLLNFGSWLLYALLSAYYEPLMPGVSIPDDWALFLCPMASLMEGEYVRIKDIGVGLEYLYIFEGLGDVWWYLLGLGVLSVVLIGLSIFAYRKRQLEHAGEFVVFRFLKPIIWALIALTIGLIFHGVGLLSGTVTVFLLIGLTVGGMLSEMLVTKSGKTALKGLGKGGILAAIVGVSLFVVSMDFLGIVRWVPEPDEVESVRISAYFYDDGNSNQFKDPTMIQAVADAHKILTEVGQSEYSLEWLDDDYGQAYIRYQLKNGKVVVRRYYYELTDETNEAFQKIWTNAAVVLDYEDWDAFLKENQEIWVYGYNGGFQLSASQSKGLLTAIKKDCDEGTWVQTPQWAEDSFCEVVLANVNWISVSSGSKNTVKWIRENLPQIFE